MTQPIRIANCSGFYGDRLAAAKEMVEGGPIDVLTGDWLAELTMLILAKNQQRRPDGGYAGTFVKQMEQVLAICLEKGIKVVTNAGGLDPRACAAAVKKVAEAQGLKAKVAWIEGDDLMPRMNDLKAQGHTFEHLDTGAALGDEEMLTANAYIGGWGITEALNRGADVVITGRATDAAIVSGPAAWHHGWKPQDYDQLAGAIVAGHVIECGAQATGGNYCFFEEIPDLTHPGFPIAEIAADGSSVITKHESHGGLVNKGTVTAQLLYEIGEAGYKNPDVISRFDTIKLEELAPNRVQISGVRGEAPPKDLKVSMNYTGGWRTILQMGITGLNAQAKADLFLHALWSQFPNGRDSFDEVCVDLLSGPTITAGDYSLRNEDYSSILRIVVKSKDHKLASKDFFKATVEIGLGNYPGLYSVPGSSQAFGVCWPSLLPAELVTQQVYLDDEVTEISCAPCTEPGDIIAQPDPSAMPDFSGETRMAPLGSLFGARSGDKAGNANLGVWARRDAAYAWLEQALTTKKLADIMPEARELSVERHVLPSIRAVNFVFKGLLGEGVAASTRIDAQAKSLGEYFRAIQVPLPVELLED